MSKIEVNTVAPQCGTTLTLGESGDTVTLGTGASQSGFGRNGSVNWQTTIKTGDFTAASGEGYFVNTTSGPVTLTLPSSPSVGDIVAFKDYAGTFQTNNLTIDRNGSNVVSGTVNPVIDVEGQSVILVYGDATQGWQPVEAATNADLPRPSFVTATGGTITTSGDCKIHTFTGPGTFCVSALSNVAANNEVSYVVVAGGGGSAGFKPCSPAGGSGGGGAGGYRESKSPVTPYTASPLDGRPSAPNRITVTATSFPIGVGGGGAQGPRVSPGGQGTSGVNSTFSTITAAGGGGGSNYPGPGIAGGSGGAGRGGGGGPCEAGGAGNTPPTTPAQGQAGGPGGATGTGGGGGGATAAGTGGVTGGCSTQGGPGGAGATSSINGTPTARAGGGGGSTGPSPAGNPGGVGGAGGGGNGGVPGSTGQCGTANTGGGGGGAKATGTCEPGTNGGSGVVIIRYKFQ